MSPSTRTKANLRQSIRRKERRLYLQKIKVERGCADCGYNSHYAALQFDHVGSNKEYPPVRLINYGWPTIYRELSKCEVVCANCHAIRTTNRYNELAGILGTSEMEGVGV